MGNDNLSIISFNSSRRGLLTLSQGHRPSYLQSILEKAEPDICFLPGDDTTANLNVIRGYGQYTLPHNDDTVLLYDNNRVSMTQPKVNMNSFGPIPGLDLDKLVVPDVEVSTLKPYKQVVKTFSMVSWKFDFFETANMQVETLVEGILRFSQCLALSTRKSVLIGGEMKIDYGRLMQIVKKLSTDGQEDFLSTLQPITGEQGFLLSMTKSSLRDLRHLFMMKVFRCKQTSSNGIVKTWQESSNPSQVVPDCFIASKQLQLEDASLLDVEQVMGRQICMPLLKEYRPTKTNMEIPVRPPRHHGG